MRRCPKPCRLRCCGGYDQPPSADGARCRLELLNGEDEHPGACACPVLRLGEPRVPVDPERGYRDNDY